jgi:hypothetical protein
MEFKLPYPTETELNFTGKSDYFDRLLIQIPDLDKKYKITQNELTGWISHNYNSVFVFNKELTFKEYQKLSK